MVRKGLRENDEITQAYVKYPAKLVVKRAHGREYSLLAEY